MKRAVFLDRDGVVNALVWRGGRWVAPRVLDEFRLLPGSAEAIDRLKAAGFFIVIATNQPDIAAGLLGRETLDAMHARIAADDIRACTHADGGSCHCRKPRPGMIHDAAQEHDIDLAKSYMVGDSWRDIRSGRDAGCFTILLDPGKASVIQAGHICASLPDAADFILGRP
jgi:D-glycero-D-manno-heptose 1,7-bisphosphate phosphatase